MHDPAYKEAYSFPRMIEELVRALASQWSREIDFSTLNRLSSEYVSPGRAHHLADLLPPTPSELLVNQPLYEYFLLEERRGGTQGLPPGNLVTALVGVVRARTKANLVAQLAQLHDWLGSDRDGALDRALTTWTRRLLNSLGLPGQHLGAAATLKEVLEVIKPTGQWAVRWYEDGLEDGREQGIQQGRSQGQAHVVRQLAVRKFGAEAAGVLTDLLDRVTDPEVIEELAKALVDSDNAEDFVEQVSHAALR